MVSVGKDFVVAIRSDGVVHAWGGQNEHGQLNVPSNLASVKQVSAGDGFVLVVQDDGTVRGWGRNDSGQLTIPPGLTDVISVAAGSGFAYALKADGTLVCWGKNSTGQLLVPHDIQVKGAKAVSCSGNKIAIIGTDDTVVTMN
jgi:alpha-tubulin suppressor-like RCC1 family protein